MTRRRLTDWSARLRATLAHAVDTWGLPVLAVTSFGLGTWGFRQLLGDGANLWWDAAYRSLQMFFMNFEHPDPNPPFVEWQLQAARFGAAVTAIWAILKALFPQARQTLRRWLRWRGKSCAVILGYGPVGQAIGRALPQRPCGIRRVTAVHAAISPELAARARADGVLLIEGDPSDPQVLRRVFAQRADRIFVCDPDDLRAMDTAVAARQHIPDPAKDIRVILNDSAVARQMAEATGGGFLGVPGLRWFSLADESARLLIAEARFDRVAVETGAKRLHLVILGCGSQGEAIAVETLLTGWRTSLLPPRITFLDKDVEGIKARMRRRMPVWFLQPDGAALPESARPIFDFHNCDAEMLDFARDTSLDGLREGVTAWVFATGNDALNLRASLALHRAVAMRAIDPAPIHIRIPGDHVDDAPDLVRQPLAMARTFGAIDSVVARSSMLIVDPDGLPKKLHAAYAYTAVDMGLTKWKETWESLSETKRNANRALFRHAAMKLEDFGAEAQLAFGDVPIADPRLRLRIADVDAALDYGSIGPGEDTNGWFKPDAKLQSDDPRLALRLRDAAVCEHKRWTTERALEQFVLTDVPDRTLRNNERRLHPYMHDWYNLTDGNTRRFDTVLLRALLGEARDHRAAAARPLSVKRLFLSVRADLTTKVTCVTDPGIGDNWDATELHLHLFAEKAVASPSAVKALMTALTPYLDKSRQAPPRRIRFDFTRPPSEGLLALANAVAAEIRHRHAASISTDPFWGWRSAQGANVGVVGHCEMYGFGELGEIENRLRQEIMSLSSELRAESLICGYAPGADQLAVQAWRSLGLPAPRLVFPFAETGLDGAKIFHTDDPGKSTPATRITEDDAWDIGVPVLPDGGSGHAAQAETVLACADVLIAVLDRNRTGKPSGTKETADNALAMGKHVIEIPPPEGVAVLGNGPGGS